MNIKPISPLHYITTSAQLADEACNAGVNWIQLRIKEAGYSEWLRIALETREVCSRHKAIFLVNDNITIAKESGADGVHLGKMDMSPSEARAILGDRFIIGGTANTYEDVVRLVTEGVDYIGLGPFRFTNTKKNLSPILGLEGYKSILLKMKENNISIPIIAIGGIVSDDIKNIKSTGVHGIAISSAITLAENKEELVGKLLVSSH